MSDVKNKDFAKLLLFNIFVIVLFVILLVVGTFCDRNISDTLYLSDNIIAKCLTCLGVYPFFASGVIFLGALYEKTVHSSQKKAFKGVMGTLCILVAVFVGFIGAGSLVDKETLGSFFPELNRNIPVIICVSLVSICPLFLLGYRLAGKTGDKQIVKRIICLLVLLILSYAALQITKGIFHRPRYRLSLLGYEGIGFEPWYRPFADAEVYIEKLGIESGEFRSFPSGHSILSMASIFILQSFSWFIPKLKSKRFMLSVIGLVFAIMIMFTRLVLGAHYLSDVSAGALIAAVLGLIYTIIQHCLDRIK